MTNVCYKFPVGDGVGYGLLTDGTEFMFDAIDYEKIKNVKFYRTEKNAPKRRIYIADCRGKKIHTYLLGGTPGYEVDHINLDTFDNRRCNLRVCTHQQNQCNQPLQKNNISGVTGVSFYAPRKKYRARIKIYQHDIHLGYYETFEAAVQARNIGMSCMFGEYGIYNDTGYPPKWLIEKVMNICKRFVNLSICEAFILSVRTKSKTSIPMKKFQSHELKKLPHILNFHQSNNPSNLFNKTC